MQVVDGYISYQIRPKLNTVDQGRNEEREEQAETDTGGGGGEL